MKLTVVIIGRVKARGFEVLLNKEADITSKAVGRSSNYHFVSLTPDIKCM